MSLMAFCFQVSCEMVFSFEGCITNFAFVGFGPVNYCHIRAKRRFICEYFDTNFTHYASVALVVANLLMNLEIVLYLKSFLTFVTFKGVLSMILPLINVQLLFMFKKITAVSTYKRLCMVVHTLLMHWADPSFFEFLTTNTEWVWVIFFLHLMASFDVAQDHRCMLSKTPFRYVHRLYVFSCFPFSESPVTKQKLI